MKSILVLFVIARNVWAYVPGNTPVSFAMRSIVRSHHDGMINGAMYMGDSSSPTTTSSAVDFLKDLLTGMSVGNGGEKLLAASSDSWRNSIFKAVGAPDKANEQIVAKALQDAMSSPDNQFAILMGKAEPFLATFPATLWTTKTTERPGSNAAFAKRKPGNYWSPWVSPLSNLVRPG